MGGGLGMSKGRYVQGMWVCSGHVDMSRACGYAQGMQVCLG